MDDPWADGPPDGGPHKGAPPPFARLVQCPRCRTAWEWGERAALISAEGSVTRWLALLRAGDPAGMQPLWERYFRRLVGLARARLRGSPCRVADEEDVALSAFDSFCRHAEAGRFAGLLDRDGLWRLLVVLTARKEEYQRLLACLQDRELETIAQRRLEGYTVEEISARLGYAARSIKRKLQLIRAIWEKEVMP